MIKEKDVIFALPNLREWSSLQTGLLLKRSGVSKPKGKEKKEKEIFLKKLVSLKRSCTFAAAN